MTISLKAYQRRALQTLKAWLDDCRLFSPAQAFERNVDQGLIDQYKAMPGLESVPYGCLRIPTGGGKTVMGAHIIDAASKTILEKEYPLVLWMVPSTNIKDQTIEAFSNAKHPYRQELDAAFKGQVAIFDIADYTNIRPADLGTKVCIVVTTLAAIRISEQEGRKVYEHHENLESHFAGSTANLEYLDRGSDGKALASFANVLKLHGPLVITDEAHNATTELSYEVYQRVRPRAVVELTATPNLKHSNVLVSVSAFELKDENMIKFPIVLKEHEGDWKEAIASAVARRNTIAKLALGEPEYIRPILLIQAENARGVATVAEVRKHLIEVEKVAAENIAVATGTQREIDGVDLFAKDCKINVIITKQALKEGWDCSFAYVFCSVAQVKSEKDVQQLLGRVLRMPYASPRTQREMSNAYAHVTTDRFGAVASELTAALSEIGFNPFEATHAIKTDASLNQELGLEGGAAASREPIVRIPVQKAPDLSNSPANDQQRVLFVPDETGKSGVVEVTGEIDPLTNEAIVEASPAKEREATKKQLELHQMVAITLKAPCQNGASLQVPRLCMMEQGVLEFVDHGIVSSDFAWDLLEFTPDLTGFKFNESSKTFELDLDGNGVSYHLVKNDVETYLPGFSQDRTADDLIGWLDQQTRDPSIRQPVMREWLRRAVAALLDRGFSLDQLLIGKFVLLRKLSEQLAAAKVKAYTQGFQQALFEGGLEILSSDGPDHTFVYDQEITSYPARFYYEGNFRFKKHFYPKVGDLKWRTEKGNETEEFHCAQALEMLDQVEIWVRNLVHPSQFWMPTSKMRTYPDFVAKLRDGRIFVVEYKGGDRFTADQEKEKRLVGRLWADRSEGKGIYLMAQKVDEKGRSLYEQLIAAIEA